MSDANNEESVIADANLPVTSAAIVSALGASGVRRGGTAIVHSSLSRLGWVVGGAHAVVLALLEAVGPEGTIVMPSLSSDLSEPSLWVNPPAPEAWWPVIRAEMPAFDAALTPTSAMGAVVDCFRHHPSSVRGQHPSSSFVACGPKATRIVHPHPLSPAFGDGSPLSRLYDLDARIVLLGVGHAHNTSLHLAECRAEWPGRPTIPCGAPVLVDGERRWVAYDDVDYDADDFAALGAAFAEATSGETRVQLGSGEVVSCAMREIVDFGSGWLARNRT